MNDCVHITLKAKWGFTSL